MSADLIAGKLSSLGSPTQGENVWAALREWRLDNGLATQDAWAAYLAPTSDAAHLNDDLYAWASNQPPNVLSEAVFLIDASRNNGPGFNLPLFGATFLIDATMETY
jgi:hypothetical protein